MNGRGEKLRSFGLLRVEAEVVFPSIPSAKDDPVELEIHDREIDVLQAISKGSHTIKNMRYSVMVDQCQPSNASISK